jgi:hypothetical protein
MDSCDPLRSHAMELKIAKLKKAEGEIKLYEEETISKIKREMLSFMRREPQDQEGKVEDMCKELVRYLTDFCNAVSAIHNTAFTLLPGISL